MFKCIKPNESVKENHHGKLPIIELYRYIEHLCENEIIKTFKKNVRYILNSKGE